MRYFVTTSILVTVLGACAPVQPDDVEFAGGAAVKPAAGTAAPVPETIKPVDIDAPSGTTVTQTIDRTAQPTTATPAPTTNETVTIDLSGGTAKPAAPVLTEGDGSISNSQDFETVKASETIESDAAKLEALKSQYEIVQPGAAPTRDGSSNVNLAKFAAAQTNPVGQKAYSRFSISGARKAARKCAEYSVADDAQTEFLARGGPQKDTLGLDPDGDGYACSWSPKVYKALLGQQ